MTHGKYILVNGEPVEEPDLTKWGEWFEGNSTERIVARTKIGDAEVSTVFLSIDHSFLEKGPVLWETMVFGGPLGGKMNRYRTRAQAEAGHAAMVKRCRAARGE
jgi:hypothetical protein